MLSILYGLALGDALGFPVEFLKPDQIRTRYGAQGILEPPSPALITDDTQMTLALAYALIDSGDADTETFMANLSKNFVAWSHHPDTPSRAPGNTCLKAIAHLEKGIHWREAGIKESKGCGSAMRNAPIGYLYQHDEDRLREIAHVSGFATHQHPAADAASIAAAYLIKLALDGVHPKEFSKRIMEFCDGISDEFDLAVLRVNHTLGWANTDAAIKHIGEGWVGEEAVALAIYCCLKHPDDYVAAVRLGANIEGDSDSVACIAGGIMGARLGLEAIPKNWIDRLERREEIGKIANLLTHQKANRKGAKKLNQ